MTTSTLEHASYVISRTMALSSPQLEPDAVPDEAVEALTEQRPVTPDPDARQRMAAALYRITGWATFGGDERSYVSRLWAEDWDSPEDAIYDEP